MPSTPAAVIDAEAAARPQTQLERALRQAAREGGAPAGGPALSRREIEILRGPKGPAQEAILRARSLEWQFRRADRRERVVLEAQARSLGKWLGREAVRLREVRDLDGSRAVLDAETGLRRALEGVVSATPLAGAENDAVRIQMDLSDGESEKAPRLPPGPSWVRLVILLLLLGGVSTLAWKTKPPEIVGAKALPAASQLSRDLKLREIHVAGKVLIARSDVWHKLDPALRDAEAERACARARVQGFQGLVLKDAERKTAFSCTGEPASPASPAGSASPHEE